MDTVSCVVSGCKNSTTTTPDKCFYPFPIDFNLCMQWIENCGTQQFFEDFAYSGTRDFLDKKLCSDHFMATDFIDEQDMFSGLKSDSVPTANVTDCVFVKQEREDADEFFEICDEQLVSAVISETEIEVSSKIKLEEASTNIEDDAPDPTNVENPQNYLLTKETATEEEEEFSPNEDTITQDSLQTEDPATESMLPIMVISKAKLQWRNRKSQNADNLKSAWKNALEIATGRDAVKNELPTSNETDEQRKRRNCRNALRMARRRARETEQERKDRLYKNTVRVALRRSLETEEEQRERKMKNALRASMHRAMESPAQRERRRQKDLIRAANRRRNESDMQAKLRKYSDALRAACRRNSETEEQRQHRKMVDVLRAAKRRKMETPEQRAARLRNDRERAAKRRSLEKYAKEANINPSLFKGRIREFDPTNLAASFSEVLKNETFHGKKTQITMDHSIFSSGDCVVKQETSDPVTGIVEAEVVWCD